MFLETYRSLAGAHTKRALAMIHIQTIGTGELKLLSIISSTTEVGAQVTLEQRIVKKEFYFIDASKFF